MTLRAKTRYTAALAAVVLAGAAPPAPASGAVARAARRCPTRAAHVRRSVCRKRAWRLRAGGPQLTWTSPSSPPLSDAEAAARVVDRPEQRAGNAAANDYVPTDAELSLFHTEAASFNPLSAYVDGRDGLTDPSTDDLIQWASLKWGIPTDWLRAEYVGESGWDEGVLGDRKKVSPEWWALYPPQARLANDEVFETMGIAGVRWTPGPNLAEGDSQPINPGTEPLRWESTAFNVDYQASVLRYYYDGLCWWCGEGYVAGKAWDSVGAWYSGTWYHAGAAEYTGEVKKYVAEKPWITNPDF